MKLFFLLLMNKIGFFVAGEVDIFAAVDVLKDWSFWMFDYICSCGFISLAYFFQCVSDFFFTVEEFGCIFEF